jgi:hypothetical protein
VLAQFEIQAMTSSFETNFISIFDHKDILNNCWLVAIMGYFADKAAMK